MKYLPLILRNVARNKLRTLFTGLSIAVSLFLVVTLYSFLSSNEDVAALKAMGVKELFTPGTSTQDIIRFVHEHIRAVA